ncbi:MAG: hypothetical protein HWE20_02545 [Gammaproteobacteria bacterium]|nr:hypothetical protein [Gammaproteobacteria bacterium]
MRKKILLVDTWSVGWNFFKPVILELRSITNCDVYFLHGNSFYSPDCNVGEGEEFVTFIDIRDIRYDISGFIRLEKFDFAIFISVHDVFHRWVNECLSRESIPVFMFMHGVRVSNSSKKVRVKKPMSLMVDRFYFYLRQSFFIFKSEFKEGPLLFLMAFFPVVESLLRYRSFKKNPVFKYWGCTYTLIFMNTIDDLVYFEKFLGAKASQTVFKESGNVLSSQAAIVAASKYQPVEKSVLFFSQPFYNGGSISLANWLAFVSEVRFVFIEAGYNFNVRPHPADSKEYVSLIEELGCHVTQVDLSTDLSRTAVVVGVNSAALIGAITAGFSTLVIDVSFADSLPINIDRYPNAIRCEFSVADSVSGVIQDLERLRGTTTPVRDVLSPSSFIAAEIRKNS